MKFAPALFRLGLLCFLAGVASPDALSQPRNRDRILFNDNWRFTKGDPEGTGDRLSYAKIKDWVTRTGENMRNPANATPKQRPEGRLGADVAYTRSEFNDANW